MRIVFLILMLVSAALFAGAGYAGDNQPYREITAEELQALQKDLSGLIVIDSRAPEQAAETGIIAGAVNLPVYDTDEDHMAKLVPDKNTPLAFYCNDVTCGASALAAFKAQKLGYTQLYKYPGGIKVWLEKNLPVEPYSPVKDGAN